MFVLSDKTPCQKKDSGYNVTKDFQGVDFYSRWETIRQNKFEIPLKLSKKLVDDSLRPFETLGDFWKALEYYQRI